MKVERHAWVKVKLHVYVCKKCGTGKVNEPDRGGWRQRYHRPTGVSEVLRHVPPCEVGPRTADYLAKYAAAIALAADGVTFKSETTEAAAS